ncbi:MAG: hypothetical protein JW797_10065 [Bradymonadales bacterium]|nr:hypothetical protein [Bradymonadales bacterium]
MRVSAPGLGTRIARGLLILALAGSLLVLSGCPKSPLSSEEALQLLFNQLWAEDQLVFATCRALNAEDSSQMAGLLSASQMADAAKNELLREAVENHGSLLSALGIDVNLCSPQAIIQRSLLSAGVPAHVLANLGGLGAVPSFSETGCMEQAVTRFNQLEQALSGRQPADTNSLRLYQALRTAGVTAERLLSDPVGLARLIDLSPAVIYTVIYFADRMDDLTEQLSGGFGFARGFVRLLLDQVAAELLAVTTGHLLDRLEDATLISRASISRHACRLYEGATSRPQTTVRLLKRMVLRFQVSEPGGQASLYAMAGFCDQLSDRGVCEEMADELEMEDLFDPQRRGSDRYTVLVPSLPAESDSLSRRPPADWSDQILEAAERCAEPCNLESINQTASLLAFTQQQPQVIPDAVFNDVITQISQGVHTDLEIIRNQVGSLEREVVGTRQTMLALVNLYREGASSADVLRQDLINTLMRLSNCQAEYESVRRARIAFVQDVLRVTEPVTCEGGPDTYVSGRFPSVRIPSGAVCDPSQSFDFDISTDGLFNTCDDIPLPEGERMLTELFASLVQLRPQSIMVMGHADQRPIETGECMARFLNNTVLSEARAQRVGELARQSIGGQLPGLQIQTIGVGDINPRESCPPGSSDECHRKNRRVTLRLIGATGVSFTFSCVGGR